VDLAGGQVDLLFDQASSTVPNVRGGKIRALAVASSSRQSALPDTPTFAEAGLRDFEIDNFTGLAAPPVCPPTPCQGAYGRSEGARHAAGQGSASRAWAVQPVGNTPEQFGVVIREDLARWSKVIKSAGVKVE